jgi:hypothetical protein
MIILGCVKMDLLISRFDGKTVNGITYHLVSQQGIQAVFKHDAESDEQAIGNAKMLFHTDPDLKQYLTTARECVW